MEIARNLVALDGLNIRINKTVFPIVELEIVSDNWNVCEVKPLRANNSFKAVIEINRPSSPGIPCKFVMLRKYSKIIGENNVSVAEVKQGYDVFNSHRTWVETSTLDDDTLSELLGLEKVKDEEGKDNE